MNARPPSWVSAPPAEAGSIDPLGYQTEVDRISESILPGITVFTTRIRYLSFLAWAFDHESGQTSAIDRWDVALSIGEHLRHHGQGDCKYPGIRLLQQQDPSHNDPVRSRLHTPPTRLRYIGLLRSCGFIDKNDAVTDIGKAVAHYFAKDAPRSRPKIVWACLRMPCLSAGGGRELKRLQQGLLQETEQAQIRNETFRELGKNLLRASRSENARFVLREYLRAARKSRASQALHEAAVLELEALPLTQLFQFLYRNGEHVLKGSLPKATRLKTPYHIPSPRRDPRGFFHAIAAHLDCAERMGRRGVPRRNLQELKQYVIELHRRAKPDGPWIDEGWRQLRKGLAKEIPGLHGYRISQFASLLSDIGTI